MSNSLPLVTINLVVLNGAKYARHCLNGILAQSYPHELIELNILDNGSSDDTKKIVKDFEIRIKDSKFANFFLLESENNLGMWPGQEELLKYSKGKYVLTMAIDVILDKDFIKNAVEVMEQDNKIGALEAKIFKYDLIDNQPRLTKIIDTLGFKIERSRRVTNIGHGEIDNGQYNDQVEIFGVEGACPFFRREAIENIRIDGEFSDHDYFWYGDDLDIAWRLNIFGWKQILAPSVLAWHDRQTTKSLRKSWLDSLFRISVRRQIPIRKRGLDWRNTRFTLLKNDYIINVLRDLPFIVLREGQVLFYTLIFEQGVLRELPNFLKAFPKMLKKRKEIMSKAIRSDQEIRKWFK